MDQTTVSGLTYSDRVRLLLGYPLRDVAPLEQPRPVQVPCSDDLLARADRFLTRCAERRA